LGEGFHASHQPSDAIIPNIVTQRGGIKRQLMPLWRKDVTRSKHSKQQVVGISVKKQDEMQQEVLL